MHVLLIEDDPHLCVFYTRALKRAGYDVTAEHRGDDGLLRAFAGSFDMIVLDWYLPGLDGITLLKELRGRGFEGPILMLSGSGEMARDEAIEAGADSFLGKPCGLEDLTNCVAIMTGRTLGRNLSAHAA